MNIVEGLRILNDCARIKKLVGLNANYPYTLEQVVDAALIVKQEIDGFNERVKLAEQRMRAAEARAAKKTQNEV